MSFDMLMKEVQALGDNERRKLLAFIVTMEDKASAGYAERLAEKIDDSSPGRWLTVEECERELGLSQDPQ